jgi:transcriptional regulator with XRE-family HTH domain
MLQQRLGQRIAELRRDRGLTQVQLARAVGSSMEFISRLERGVNAPSVAWLEGLARALKVEVVDLFAFPSRKRKRMRRQRRSKRRTWRAT